MNEWPPVQWPIPLGATSSNTFHRQKYGFVCVKLCGRKYNGAMANRTREKMLLAEIVARIHVCKKTRFQSQHQTIHTDAMLRAAHSKINSKSSQ